MNRFLCFLLLVAFCFFWSCRHDEGQEKFPFHLQMTYDCQGNSILLNTMAYTNAAGNQYEVDELQYFISKVRLHRKVGPYFFIAQDDSIHYFDLALPATQQWILPDTIPGGLYDSISFVFGLDRDQNISNRFPNPPERDMFWPEMMGGGYHFMKLNGKWKAANGLPDNFGMHLGVGMAMDGSRVNNSFTISIPISYDPSVNTDGLHLVMNVDRWFDTPYLWDWNVVGGSIMQNQDAMHKVAENGKDVFEQAKAL